MPASPEIVFIAAGDGVRLAVTLYLPAGAGPFATLLEALPYRMNDVTSSYADSYHRFVDEGGFAVLRVDVRGTGCSGGLADDEYPDAERSDLRTVMEWIAAQPWSSGRVGMFGTSYSGFNSLHMAVEGVPQLGAVAAMYATDDRYTDDVHYAGGVLRALDLVDYPLYMIAMNALPPTPAVWGDGSGEGSGDGWAAEWQRRIEQHEPWLLEWLRHPLPDCSWRRGSVRLGPGGAGYVRATCPVLLIAGWADGYRNNTFRTLQHMPGSYLLAGPWSHKDPSVARPGPNIDCDRELMRFFDEHLRGGPARTAPRGEVFVRRPTAPQPDLAVHAGHWVGIDGWPEADVHDTLFEASSAAVTAVAGVVCIAGAAGGEPVDVLNVFGDVGTAAWNSCAGGLPWGQPLDQRADNARSITYEWLPQGEAMLVGNGEVALQVCSSAPAGHVSVKLCDVAPDGTSTLITRGMLDLQQRGVWPSDPNGSVGAEPQPVVPGEWTQLAVPLEATTWTLLPGHRLRLAVAGTDWPNCWPPAQPFTLSVRRHSVQLTLPLATALPSAGAGFTAGPGPGSGADEADGVEWRVEHDVLARETRVHTRYGGSYPGTHGTGVSDAYEGTLGISTTDLANAWARGRSRFDLTFALPDGSTTVCSTEATLHVRSDHEWFHVEISLTAQRDGSTVVGRSWTETLPR
ncbi:MAG: CocE/NonD family hydrolase [Actinomycetota bacterium]|nr:CocE/NonD family hydrolase [Actinomycetota bacterium]